MPRRFLDCFIPDAYYESIYDIDLEALKRQGLSGLIVDLDNTLAAWRFGEPTPELAAWMDEVKAKGFRPYIVSNDLGPRVDLFTRFLGIPGRAKAGKPRHEAFRAAAESLGLPPAKVAVVGDQVFTDIFGAKPVGCYTILIVPISRREFFGTRLVRRVERAFLRYLAKRGIIGEPVRR